MCPSSIGAVVRKSHTCIGVTTSPHPQKGNDNLITMGRDPHLVKDTKELAVHLATNLLLYTNIVN